MSPYGSLFPDGIHPNADGYAIMAQIADTAILTSPPGFIRYFIPSVTSFEKGQSVSLYWEATAGSAVTLDGAPVSSLDSTVVRPAGTTAYTLIAGGTEFSDTNTLTLNYVAPGTIKTFTAEPPILDLGVGDSSILRWTTARGSTVLLDGQPVEPNGSASVAPTATMTYTLVGSGEITDSAFATVLLLPSEQINRALNKPVQTSSTQYGSPSQEAVDGDTSTAWRSKSGASQWILVNLGKSRSLTRVVLKWGAAFGTSYTVQGLDSAGVPKNLFTTGVGDGGVDDIDTLHGVGKYVRLILTRKNLADSGYVLREIEVYSAPATSSVDRANEPIGGYVLEQNYPNPFNPETDIRFRISDFGWGNLSVYDMLGRQVAVLVNEKKEPGTYEVRFDARLPGGQGSTLPSGMYVYRMKAGTTVLARRMMLLK
jgi:hypothetical protein